MQTPEEFIERHRDDVALVINLSGGKDSSRMLGFIRSRFPSIPTYCVMADTGFEHVRPVSAVSWSERMAARFGLPLHVVRNPNKTYLEMVKRRGMFPSAQFRQCTSDLKRGPIQKFVRGLPHKMTINCMGMRAEESSQPPWSRDEAMSTAGRTVYNWLPIFNETQTDVLEWHWTNGVPLHPVYAPEFHRDGTDGGYLRRFSCRVCIFASDQDIRQTFAHDREAFDLISALEVETGFTMKAGKSLVQIATAPLQAARESGQLRSSGVRCRWSSMSDCMQRAVQRRLVHLTRTLIAVSVRSCRVLSARDAQADDVDNAQAASCRVFATDNTTPPRCGRPYLERKGARP